MLSVALYRAGDAYFGNYILDIVRDLWEKASSRGVPHMTPIFALPQSVSVQTAKSNPGQAVLIVVERAANPADTRTFEFPMNVRELGQLRADIDAALSTMLRPG